MRAKFAIISVLAVLFIGIEVHSQTNTFNWAFDIGVDGNNEYIDEMVTDLDNNIIVVGTIGWGETIDFDPSSATNNIYFDTENFFIAKYSSDKELLWVKPFINDSLLNFENINLLIDNQNNIWLVGGIGTFKNDQNIYAQIDFDPSPSATYYLRPEGYENLFVLKLDETGSFITANLTGNGTDINTDYIYPYTAVLDNDYNLLIAGCFNNSMDFEFGSGQTILTSVDVEGYNGDDAFIAKYSSDLSLLWIKQGIADRFEIRDIDVDNQNNMYMIGYCSDYYGDVIDLDFGTGNNIVDPSGYDPFIMKYAADGNFVVGNIFKGYNYQDDYLKSIDIDDSDNVFVVGNFSDSIDVDISNSVLMLHPVAFGNQNLIVAKYNSDLELQSAKSIGNVNDNHIFAKQILFKNNELFICGEFSGNIDFDPSNNDFFVSTTDGVYTDGFLLKMNENIDFVHAFNLGGNFLDHVEAIALDQNSNLIVSGRYSMTIDFDFSTNNFTLTTDDYRQIYVAKYNTAIVSINEIKNTNFIFVYPNPANNVINISVSLTETIESIKIYNQSGQLVKQITKPQGTSINISDLNKGLYFIRTDTETNRYLSKMIKE